MDIWTLEKLRDNSLLENCSTTACNDCYLLGSSEPNYRPPNYSKKRGYSIFKIINTIGESAYIMFLEEGFPLFNAPPVLLTESEALEFLNNPKKAEKFAVKAWAKRYR